MGRSVAVPTDAVATVYLHDPAGMMECPEEDFLYAWDDFVEYLVDIVRTRYPSMDTAERWLGREERVVAENFHACVVVCEYCGCVSVSLVVDHRLEDKGDYASYELAKAWCERVADGFNKLIEETYSGCVIRRLGTMSNGVSVFERAIQELSE